MKKKTPIEKCVKCGDYDCKLRQYGNGYICERCLERLRVGRDTSTRAARALILALTQQGTANIFRYQGDDERALPHQHAADEYGDKSTQLFKVTEPVELALGEVVPPKRPCIADTLKTPDRVALDASAHRIEMLARLGTDCTALALDAADSIKAENSLEKMLAHQLAIAHKTTLDVTEKAMLEPDTMEKARLLNVVARMMETFQRGLLTLQRLRTNGDQRITVQYVTVADGGQAVVGDVQTGGVKK